MSGLFIRVRGIELTMKIERHGKKRPAIPLSLIGKTGKDQRNIHVGGSGIGNKGPKVYRNRDSSIRGYSILGRGKLEGGDR